ncbi:MAG: hypothetical protein JNM14_16425 [Ferruginibacter sp.]|nr:hypothetical protein [Ferruginibacter sp.]
MKRTSLLSAVLSLFLLVPASITRAQTVSSQKGLTTAVFNVQQGIIKVYLPDDIRPGDIISGSINTEANGNNAKQLSTNQQALKQYTVSIINNKISVDNKLFQITVPPGKPLPVQVLLSDAASNKVSAITVRSISENNTVARSSACNIPSLALTDAPLRINGPFDGDASNTKCSLGGKPLHIIAESPRQCILLFPGVQAGNHTLNCQEGGKQSCTGNIGAIDMNVTAGKMNLRKGEKTYIDVKISGLENLHDTARLSVTNTSAGVIAITGANNTTLSIPPSAVNTNGIYSRRFNAESIQTGTFTVNIDLDLPETKPATQHQPVYNMKVWLPLKGGDLSATYDEQTDEAKVDGGENVYIIDNAIRIFLNGIFLQEYDMANDGTSTVQQILTEYSDTNYAEPGIGCDSLNRICNKNAAFNVFWGDVYSVFEGKATTKLAKGEVIENASQNSLLITRGWEIDCCTGEYRLKLFFQSMSGGGEKGSHNITYSRILKTGKPCPVNCPQCIRKCDEMKKVIEESRRKMEEIRNKENGNN